MSSRIKIFLIVVTLSGLLGSCKKDERHLAISRIKGAAKLSTTETIIDKVIVGEKEKKFLGFIKLGDADFVAYSEAIVKTGVDLTELEPNDVKIDGNMIRVKLPPVKVLDFSYPFDRFRIDEHLSSKDLLVKIDVFDQEYYYRQAELDIREQLQYTGIVEETQANTRRILEGLLLNLGYEEIYISFDETKELIQTVNPDYLEERKTEKKKKNG